VRPAALILLSLLLGAWGCGGPDEPPEVPERPLSLELRNPGLPAAQIIEMACGVGGFPVEWTEGAMRRASETPLVLKMEDAPWTEVLEVAVRDAGLEWEWLQRQEEWVVVIRLPEEE
jgi:hypothetical protein